MRVRVSGARGVCACVRVSGAHRAFGGSFQRSRRSVPIGTMHRLNLLRLLPHVPTDPPFWAIGEIIGQPAKNVASPQNLCSRLPGPCPVLRPVHRSSQKRCDGLRTDFHPPGIPQAQRCLSLALPRPARGTLGGKAQHFQRSLCQRCLSLALRRPVRPTVGDSVVGNRPILLQRCLLLALPRPARGALGGKAQHFQQSLS